MSNKKNKINIPEIKTRELFNPPSQKLIKFKKREYYDSRYNYYDYYKR